jgi:hypothetical protein
LVLKLLVLMICKLLGYIFNSSHKLIIEFILLKQWGEQCAFKIFSNLTPWFVAYFLPKNVGKNTFYIFEPKWSPARIKTGSETSLIFGTSSRIRIGPESSLIFFRTKTKTGIICFFEKSHSTRIHDSIYIWNWNRNQNHSNLFLELKTQRFRIKVKNRITLVVQVLKESVTDTHQLSTQVHTHLPGQGEQNKRLVSV